MTTPVLRAQWRAMGCAASVEVVGGDSSLLDLARQRVAHFERCWTRFDASSDVCRLNSAAGQPVDVDPATLVLLDAMVQAHAVTAGAFDPTLLAPLVGLGDPANGATTSPAVPLPGGLRPRGEVEGVALDRAASVARLPVGTAIDAGGIGKGLAADLVAERLLAEGAAGAVVCIGGDLRVVGQSPHGDGWRVGVADAWDHELDAEVIAISEGGVATSGILRRHWIDRTGVQRHHLIDPDSLQPTDRDSIVQVTVVAGTAAWAEAHTKLVMVRGAGALAQLADIGLAARIVLDGGVVAVNDTWCRFAANDLLEVG